MRNLIVVPLLALLPIYVDWTLHMGLLDALVIANAPDNASHKVDWFLETASELQSLEKEKACQRLRVLADNEKHEEREKTFVLCRMLFVAKPGGEFRPPGLGGPGFVGMGPFYLGNDEEIKNWPSEPIEIVDGVPFLVVRGYWLAGSPEPASMYLEYCMRECDWSNTQFTPKTPDEKRRALFKLFASAKCRLKLTQDDKVFLAAQIK